MFREMEYGAMKGQLGRLEAQFFAYAHLRGWSTVRVGALRKPLRLDAVQERKLLSRLGRAGMIARVWRGLYLVPPRLPLGGRWSPDVGLALDALMTARGGRYQIPTSSSRAAPASPRCTPASTA